ncbi:hypothetical protein AKJ09_06325 [Labilithrix luteola]|uniref:Uncharacterized protein n=1 Tax=Labilithrix luteola TaxID=1391654 RepID=A0A0K1Q1Y1_9BACT|nr:DUF2403 domain-containing lipoprotein [Labilithrix luteola]AKU99661.1 hypothetical protein AKJ09_06325 [Labilithrix luteola]
MVARKLLGAFAFVSLLVFACGGSSSDSSSSSNLGGPGGSGGSSTPGTSDGDNKTPPPPPLGSGVGGYPVDPSTPTLGGTMTFTNVGAPGFWPRRINREAGDPACNYKDGTDTWGGHCCMKEQHEEGDKLAPFDQEMTLILKAIDVKQVAVYQPATSDAAQWGLVSSWDRRNKVGQNLGFTQGNDQQTTFEGDLQKSDCVWYLAQTGKFDCGDGRDYYCPKDPGVNRLGWTGSKLFVLLGSMTFDDAGVQKCNGGGASGSPGPWVALVASELIRDGGRKWNGACNCYSKTGSVGDGCGEINLFEVVMDNNEYSNREFASTGVRSYQKGHVGGNVCGTGCSRGAFADDVEVLDACSKTAYAKGPEIPVGGDANGCPVWRRPVGDRYFVVLLDEVKRTIQVAVIHPSNVPSAAASLLPALPPSLGRDTIDGLISLRLPAGK